MTVENVGIGEQHVRGGRGYSTSGWEAERPKEGGAVFGRLAAVPELTANVAINGDVGNRG